MLIGTLRFTVDCWDKYCVSANKYVSVTIVFIMQGEVLGITRFGLAKMKESVLMLASVSYFNYLCIYVWCYDIKVVCVFFFQLSNSAGKNKFVFK